MAIAVVSCSLMFMKALIGRIYKNWIVQAINVTCFFNMALLAVSTLFSLKIWNTQSIFSIISGSVMIFLLLLVLSYHVCSNEICLEVWKKLNKKAAKSLEEISDVPQIDFDSRDHSPVGEFTSDKYLSSNRRELSTLPDCGNSRGKQRDECRAALHKNRLNDHDTDSEGSMTPLLNNY